MKAKLKNEVKEDDYILAEGHSDDVTKSMLDYKGSYRLVESVDGYTEWFAFVEDIYFYHFHKSWLDFENQVKTDDSLILVGTPE